jgi:hypothetical protein
LFFSKEQAEEVQQNPNIINQRVKSKKSKWLATLIFKLKVFKTNKKFSEKIAVVKNQLISGQKSR